MGTCSCEVSLSAVGGAIETSATPAAALAHVIADSKAGELTSKESQKLGVDCIIAILYTAKATSQHVPVAEREGQVPVAMIRCVLKMAPTRWRRLYYGR